MVLYLLDRLGVSFLFLVKKVILQILDGVCNMGVLCFVMKLVLLGSVGVSVVIELGVIVDWSGEMGKGYGIKGCFVILIVLLLSGQQQVNLKILIIFEVQGGGEIGVFVGVQVGGNISGVIEWFELYFDDMLVVIGVEKDNKFFVNKEKKFVVIVKLEVGMMVQVGVGGSGVFYIIYIQGCFCIYCKVVLCWGVGVKGEVGFEVDGSSFVVFMKSFMFMLRNVDYQKFEQMMVGDVFCFLCVIFIIMVV